MSKKITFVNGSLRKQSFNQEIVQYLKDELSSKGYTVNQLDISDLPLMNQDIEFPAPEEVSKVREEIRSSVGLWLVTPEYNGSVPGPLKNFLDWISRPLEQGVFGATDFVAGKLVAISGAAGRSGASLVMSELKGLLTRMGMNPLENMAGVVLPMEAFQTGKFTLSEENKQLFNRQIKDYLEKLDLQ